MKLKQAIVMMARIVALGTALSWAETTQLFSVSIDPITTKTTLSHYFDGTLPRPVKPLHGLIVIDTLMGVNREVNDHDVQYTYTTTYEYQIVDRGAYVRHKTGQGALTGTGIGGLVGGLAAFFVILIPLGGPLMAILMLSVGAAAGAGLGAGIGAIVGAVKPETFLSSETPDRA